MSEYTDFGLKARSIMLQKKITLTALAKEVGICPPYLSEIFRGTRKGETQKKKIAKILGI